MATETSYHSSSQRLYADVKGIVDQTILSSAIQNLNISESLSNNLMNGVSAKATAMYRYGKRTEDGGEGYYLGLPYGSKSYISSARITVTKLIIEREINSIIYIDKYSVDKDTPDHYAHEIMQNSYGWNATSNILSNPPFDSLGETVTYGGSEVTGEGSIAITYNYGTLTYVQDISGLDAIIKDLYYYVNYRVVDNKGEPSGAMQYWRYRENAGTHPELTIHEVDEDLISPFYPIVPLREDSVDLTDPLTRNEPNYRSSKQCLRYINIDIDQIVEGLNENEDIATVDHAYIMLGIDLATELQASKKYLYEFFNDLATSSSMDQGDFDYWFKNNNGTTPPPVNTIVIADAKYRSELSWNFISKTTVHGVIGSGKIGEVTIAAVQHHDVTTDNDGYESYDRYTGLYVSKQISKTQYVKLFVRDLLHINYVYSGHTIKTSIITAFDPDYLQGNFIIPVNHVLAKNLGIIHGHDMLQDAIRVVFNSKIRTHLEWYETKEFRIIIVILVVIYEVATLFADGGAAFTWATALMAAGEILLEMIVYSLIAGAVLQVARDVFGEEVALMLAIAATFVTFDATTGFALGTNSAMQIYSAVTQAITGANTLYQQNEMRKLEGEQKEIDTLRELYMEEHEDDIDDPLGLLGLGSEYTYTYDVVKDSPSYYYTRTIHAGFIDTTAIIGPEYYVDSQMQLDLPYSPIRTRVF